MSGVVGQPVFLVSIARSKPTAFQAVSFEPPDPRENRGDGGIQAECARGFRPEVPHDLVYEISKENPAGKDSGACARPDPADLCCTECDDRERVGVSGPHSSADHAFTSL